MSVSRMEKIFVLGHTHIREGLISKLREFGAIQISELKDEKTSDNNESHKIFSDNCNILEQTLNKLNYTSDFYVPYEETESFIDKLFEEKMLVSSESILKIEKEFDLDAKYKEAYSLDKELKQIRNLSDKYRSLIKALEPWKQLKIELKNITSTHETYISLAEVKTAKFSDIESSFSKLSKTFAIKVINHNKDKTYFVIVFLKNHEREYLNCIKEHEVKLIKFSDLTETPANEANRLKNEIASLSKQQEKLFSRAKHLSKERKKALILIDYYSETLAKTQVLLNLSHTNETFALKGWIKKSDQQKVFTYLTSKYKEIVIEKIEPDEGEEPPIILENKNALKPFEFITTLYSNPRYKEVDPTPLLAPFFIIFFAFCLTDAGYGITLSIVSILLLKFFKFGAGARKLFKILFACGLMTILFGALTGGWFGIEGQKLAEPLQKIVVIDPLKDPLKLLNIAFVLGLFQIFFGLGVKMYENLKSKDYFAAICDQLFWIILLFSLAPLGYVFILGGKINNEFINIFKNSALVMLVLIVLTGGRDQKNILLKPLMGAIKLYDIVGYFGDVLSYARLLALGLATSAIALTINNVAKMVLDLPYYTGYIIAGLILIAGHIFNLLINSLGAFVHSMRLQYLEFFSKFFSGGGKPFKPFKEERKYSVIKNNNE